MKTAKIKVNKTEKTPDGVEIEIVQPEGALETKVMSYLLSHAVRQARGDNKITYKLPENFSVDPRGEGTFVVMGSPPPPPTASPVRGGGYYQPPQPLAIVGVRTAGPGFDLIHAELNLEALKKVAEAQKAAKGEGRKSTEPASAAKS